VYFGLLSILTQVGVAESEKRVAAIFLLPVWALEPPKRSFRPYFGSYGCLMAGRRPVLSRIGSRGRGVKKSGRRHISTSGLVSSALATLVFAVFWPVWPLYRR